jgi:hypothetical protein
MSAFSDLFQNNWYALANILVQLLFLIAGVWFARNILKGIRASQEQFGALLKLSITGAAGERDSSVASAKRSLAETSPYWLVPSEIVPPAAPQPTQSGPSHFVLASRKVLLWLQTPMSHAEVSPLRRVITWLQAPAGN